MKKVAKRVISLVLAVMMVFTSMLFGVTEDFNAADITPEEVTLTNAGFDQDYWNGWSSSFSDNDWTDGTYSLYKEDYATKGLTAPEGSNGYYLNFWKQAESTIWLSQAISELPAGEYTISIPVMGANAAVSVSLGGQTSTAKTLTGYGTWDYATATFTISEDMTDAYVVINIACSADGWGYLDRIDLTGKTVEEDEYSVTIQAEPTTVEVGENLFMQANIKLGVENAQLGDDLYLYWTSDSSAGDVAFSEYDNNSGKTTTVRATFNTVGRHTIWATLKDADGNELCKNSIVITVTEPAPPEVTLTITPETTDITKGDVVKLDAAVTVDGVPVTDLEAAGLRITWSATEEGLSDIEFDHTTLYALTTNVKLPSEGSYFVAADIADANSEVVASAKVELVAKALEDEVKKIELKNGDFSEEIVDNDPVWKGSTKSGSWTNNRFYRFEYASDAWLELASYCSGAYCMKMEAVAGDELQVVQYLETLEAGTYTMIVPVMGGDGSVKLVLGDQESETKVLQGWNNWSYVKVTFTITEDMADVPVGIKLVSSSSVGGWAFVDSISLYKGVPATGDNNPVWTYVILMLSGIAVTAVGLKKKRA